MDLPAPGARPPHDSAAVYLDELSHLAVRSFASTAEVFQAILELISHQLGMRSSFLTHIDVEAGRNTIFAAYNQPDGCNIIAGADLPLQETF